MFRNYFFGIQLFAEGSDEGTEAADTNAEANTEITDNAVTGDPETEFEELIKGRYADAFRKRTQGIIDRRFARMKNLEKTAAQFTPLIEVLKDQFPDIDGKDTAALINAFTERHNEGKADETAKAESLRLKAAAEYTAARMAGKRLTAGWEKEAEEMKNIYPSFSLADEMKGNEKFGMLLKAGIPVRLAFEAANLEKIMGAAMKYAADYAGRKTAASLRGSGNRIQENSVLDRASSVTRKDVNALTEQDIIRIINEVSKGAKISF